MHSFTDNGGRKWTFTVNMWTVRQVKRETSWDLANILEDVGAKDDSKIVRLFRDKSELFSVWCCLLAGQMEERGVSPEDLGGSLAGESIADANDAFVQALADFFPDRQSRQLKTLQAKGREVADALATVADEKLAGLDVGVLTKQVLSSLESAESIPGSTP